MDSEPHTPAWGSEALRSPHTRSDKADRVRRMFNAIAPTYERVNRLFSAGRDRAWRRRAVELARVCEGDAVLDVACGTGDFLRAFAAAPSAPQHLVGCDFAREMLRLAVARGPQHLKWCECDALHLPFADDSFTAVSCAFGVRNLQSLDDGLSEMYRVTAPGGRAVILEFARPRQRWFRAVYEVYARRVMPVGARWLSRDREGAYRYLPESVVSFFSEEELVRRLQRVGFGRVVVTRMTLGVVCIYIAFKEEHG